MFLERLHNVGVNAGLITGFDSIETDNLDKAIKKLSNSELREQQSVFEHTRQLALLVVSDLVEAISDSKLDEGEIATDRLDSLLLEAIDGSDDDDDMLFDMLVAAVSDVLETFGVDETTIDEVFSDNVNAAEAALESVANTVLANLPDEGEELDQFVRDFIFSDFEEAGFDSISKAKVKAKAGSLSMRKVGGKNIAYRGTVAIRNGKKAIVNKRLPNQKVRLSAAQKGAVKKARLKANSANAIKKRVMSLKKGRRMGLYK